MLINFNDRVSWDSNKKRGISVRDGVLEYLGAEIGREPADKIFTVYRSPASIAKASSAMIGIPLTDRHVDTDSPVPASEMHGKVERSEVVDAFDEATQSTLAVENQLSLTDSFTSVLKSGKRELSLGYKAALVEHDRYDFEQRNITPHHLAVVEAGRCGSTCSFIDKKPEGTNMLTKETKAALAKVRAFKDEEPSLTMEQVVELGGQVLETLKSLPLEVLAKYAPTLQEMVNEVTPPADTKEVDAEDETPVEAEEEMKDESPEDEEEQAKKFEDALNKKLALHTEVIEKARDFVDSTYMFKGKTTEQIMRDVLAVEHGSQTFADSDIAVAFRLLKPQATQLHNFGDANVAKDDPFLSLKDKKV